MDHGGSDCGGTVFSLRRGGTIAICSSFVHGEVGFDDGTDDGSSGQEYVEQKVGEKEEEVK